MHRQMSRLLNSPKPDCSIWDLFLVRLRASLQAEESSGEFRNEFIRDALARYHERRHRLTP